MTIHLKTEKIIIKVNSKYFRPNEVDNLRGNPAKAKNKLFPIAQGFIFLLKSNG